MSFSLIDNALPTNHLTITAAAHMQELTAELFSRTSMSGFTHTRIYNDCARFRLTTYPAWAVHFIEQRYYNLSRLDRHPSCYKEGYFLWDAWNKNCVSYNIVMKDAEDNFNGGRGISVIKKSKHWLDKYEFSADRDNYQINPFFLNNIDLLENFISFYKEKAAKLIEQAHNERYYLSYKVDVFSEYDDTALPTNILNAIDHEESLGKPKNLSLLTKKELECIAWLIRGKTLPEMAIILGKSNRTLEKFIVTIKAKLDCHTYFQIGQKVSAIGLAKLLSNI